MATLISLLRGINVSGHRRVSMADLKALYESLGYQSVRTYLQSGNVVFDAPGADPKKHASAIEKAIARILGHEVAVVVKAAKAFSNVTRSNPFVGRAGFDDDFLHATFLIHPSEDLTLDGLNLPLQGKEVAQLVGDVVFLYCPNGYGRTRINNNYFEKALRARATTRNWRTVIALDKMAQGEGG
jgi:uncharacterized protein (DUF1697 family)